MRAAAEEVLKMMKNDEKVSQAGLQWGVIEHNIRKRAFSLTKTFFLVTNLRLESLEAENQSMRFTICALNTDAKNVLTDNQPLVILGTQFSQLSNNQPLHMCINFMIFPKQ